MKKKIIPAASVQFKLSEVEDPALRERLEMQYMQLEVQKRTQVQAQRQSQRANAEAVKAMAEVMLSELDFVISAGEAFDLVQTEPNWMTRRTKDGAVVLECLLTQNDIQNIQRTQVGHVREQIAEANGGSDGDDTDLFNND
jgi:hypothetical protein